MNGINIYEAKTRLSQIVDQAAAGQDVILCRNGKPLVKVTRLDSPKRKIKFGVLKGKWVVPDDFDEPLPEEVIQQFEASKAPKAW